MIGRRRKGRNGKKWAKHAMPWQPGDIVLWRISVRRGEVFCGGCGLVLEAHDVYQYEEGRTRCRYCLGLDTHLFVPAGDGGLTTRVSTYSAKRAVVVRRGGPNVYREGVLVEEEAVRKVADDLDLDLQEIVAELVVDRRTIRRRSRSQRKVRDKPEPSPPCEPVPPRKRAKKDAPPEPLAPAPPAPEPHVLAQRLSQELSAARPRRCLEVAHWAIETLDLQELDQLPAHEIVVRWIRRSARDAHSS